MKVTILGCGPSYGVPSLTRGYDLVDPKEKKNVRTRTAMLLEEEGTHILFDTGPEIREQLLKAGAPSIDAICYTHAHYDHIAAAEDLHSYARIQGRRLGVYATRHDLFILRRELPYVFSPKYRQAMDVHYIQYHKPFKIKDIELIPILQHHGDELSVGYRIGDFAYCTDVKSLEPEGWKILKGVKTWVLGCVSVNENAKHLSLKEALKWVNRIKPERTYLTHLGSKMDYQKLKHSLPKDVEPCYDGLVIKA